MFIERSIPIAVSDPNKTPQRLEGEHRRIVKSGGVLTFNILAENNISVQELIDMGCNIKQALLLWGEPPRAHNFIFKGLTKSGLEMVSKVLRDEIFGRRFSGINWFSVGLGVKDLFELNPSAEKIKLWGITLTSLIQHNAHDHGCTFQTFLNWKQEQWDDLGFNRESYTEKIKNEPGVSANLKQRRLQWGPN